MRPLLERARDRARGWARVTAGTLRTVLGVPDYDRYVAHVRRRHPDREPVSREAFVRERLDARYSKPGARCC